jgi:hypothetical protein
MTTTTDKQATTEHLIRALYAAKAEFKDAASNLYTTQHNLMCIVSTSSCELDRKCAEEARKQQEVFYNEAEKNYNAIWKLCNKMGLCG